MIVGSYPGSKKAVAFAVDKHSIFWAGLFRPKTGDVAPCPSGALIRNREICRQGSTDHFGV
jgi:hypothetical protein